MSLWSYSNLHTDEGRKRGKGVGNELCDLLVVFGNDVIIFSDKYIKFNQTIDTVIAWKRWYKKAVWKSANQLYGAENWLRNHKERIYVDPRCTTRLPINIPDPDKIRVFRIAVALGIYKACKDFFGGNSLGSLIVNSAIAGENHYNHPFCIGHVNPSKGFVHVFEDFTLNAVLRELDTVSDFISYLAKREIFLLKDKPKIVAAGEEQLLSIYLTKLNKDGEHDFVLPGEGDVDGYFFDESFWDRMVRDPQYMGKKEADRISYVWDGLIERFVKYGGFYDESGNRYEEVSVLEKGLRLMASEPRIRRRQLANALTNLLENTPEGKGATRVFYSNDFPDNVYVFLILHQQQNETYDEYRKHRTALLLAYCKVAKLRCSNASYIIGIASEFIGPHGASEDMVVLDVTDWTQEKQEEAEEIRDAASLLLDQNVTRREERTSEYPDVSSPREAIIRPAQKSSMKKSHRKSIQKKSRKQNRRK